MHRLAAARAQANFHSAPKALSLPSRYGDQLARRDDRRPHRRRGQTQRYAIGADCPPRCVAEINLVVSRISAVLMSTRAGEGIGGQNDLGVKAALSVFDDKGRANIEPARNVIFRRFSEEAPNRRERIGPQRGEGARESREKTAAIEALHRPLHWGSGSAGGHGAPGLIKRLEVEPRDDLHQPSAWIVSVGRILVRRRHLHEAQVGRGRRGGGGRVEEVDVVEGVQELAAQFKVEPLGEPDLLLDTQVEAGEFRPGDEDALRGALAAVDLNTARVVGGRDVTPRRWAERTVAGRRSRAGVEGPDRIVKDVL